MTQEDTIRRSLDELGRPSSEDLAKAQEGPALGPDFWKKTEVRPPRAKTSIHLRVDADILEFFKEQGPGHLTRMNAVLRAYVDASRQPRSNEN